MIKARQQTDSNELTRLKQQVKVRKNQYIRMKNVVVAEAESLKV